MRCLGRIILGMKLYGNVLLPIMIVQVMQICMIVYSIIAKVPIYILIYQWCPTHKSILIDTIIKQMKMAVNI